ncbi:MAG: hypothetical protein HN509_14610 [Halobacteriovoraceae bacterium]|jgi:hypothetical protein|nr:hypothetical protein [Halobacteriovoraceae bacterium]
MTRYVFGFLILIGVLSTLNLALGQDYKSTVVTDPSISRRCEELLSKRTRKVGHKQKILALLIRNEHLQKITPPARISVLRKLKKNFRHLRHELELTQTQLDHHEENIIRKGCPGIAL